MREIKFRGQVLGVWVYGSLTVYKSGEAVIISTAEALHLGNGGTVVDPATVGQFTGLRDKNGVEIYEGDIVFGRKDGELFTRTVTGRVVFDFAGFILMEEGDEGALYEISDFDLIEVVGNIHEPKKETMD